MIRIKLWYSQIKGMYKRSKRISKKSFIGDRVQFLGLDNIEIGDNCVIGENTTFTVNDRSTKNVTLKIGSNTYIGRNNFFTVGKNIEISEYCMFGNNCSFVCSDHSFDTPLIPYRISGLTTGKQIYVGANCWFGINVTIVGDVKVGHGSIIGANVLINGDVPPFSIVVGNPFRIIKRYDFDSEKWIKGKDVASNIYFDEATYLNYLREKFGDLPIAYHSASSQFGDI